jgi:methylated-DNA-[protein]-cysteine S-methyltransferase
MRYAVMNSPIGPLTLRATEKGLSSIHFGSAVSPNGVANGLLDERAHRENFKQLQEYFDGIRTRFDLPLDIHGTPFQMAVWHELQKIPYGETRTYGEIARSIGKPGAARAVGMANHENPVAIVIPCHRVVGSDGSLTGYAGGLDLKKKLLEIELQPETQGQLLFT